MFEAQGRLLALALCVALFVAACGRDSSPATAPGSTVDVPAQAAVPADLPADRDDADGPAPPVDAGSSEAATSGPDTGLAEALGAATDTAETGGGPGPALATESGAGVEVGGAEEGGSELVAAPTAALAESPETAGAGMASERSSFWRPEDPSVHPLSIQRLRGQPYPGSELIVVEDLAPGTNYRRQVVSYESEGNTIYALLTVPNGERPATGWPVILFNHGYIPPAQYRTTERYVAYQDAFARAGYITLKSDYRGHGRSEGEATSGRGSPAYTIDVLNAMASVLRHPDADPDRVGMWGHSMGGSITLRAMVVSDKIKAGVIWAGVVASYADMYHRLGSPAAANPNPQPLRRGWRMDLVERFGDPDENPAAWDAVTPNAYLAEISGPLQLHHGSNDSSVPLAYSERLQEQMEAAGRLSELFVYPGDDHNISGNLRTALQRSVAFFDQHVKGVGPDS